MAKGKPIKVGKFEAGVECGQRWWSFNSWFPIERHPTKMERRRSLDGSYYDARVWRRRKWPKFRTFRSPAAGIEGFAVGPLMFWRS